MKYIAEWRMKYIPNAVRVSRFTLLFRFGSCVCQSLSHLSVWPADVDNVDPWAVLLDRSDTDRRGVPSDIVLNPRWTADGHVAGTGHAQTTPGEN